MDSKQNYKPIIFVNIEVDQVAWTSITACNPFRRTRTHYRPYAAYISQICQSVIARLSTTGEQQLYLE